MRFFDFFRRKKASAPRPAEEPAGELAPRLCFVLCRAETPGDPAQAQAIVTDIFGPGYTAQAAEDNMLVVQRGQETVGILGHMPAPIPHGEAEANAEGNFLWPNGREEAAQHRSHVLVTNFGGKGQSAVDSAIAVTRLAQVALRLHDGFGVYWGTASVSNSRELFEEFAASIAEGSLPIPIWLRFQLVQHPDGRWGMYTLGMRQFGLMELEVPVSPLEPSDLFEFVGNLAIYLVREGPVIGDGNTVGGSAEEKIKVRHRPSIIEPERQVYQIVYPG